MFQVRLVAEGAGAAETTGHHVGVDGGGEGGGYEVVGTTWTCVRSLLWADKREINERK